MLRSSIMNQENMKRLFLVRGLPGSGKSTLAHELAPNANVAADDYMIDDDGNYDFRIEQLAYCHAECFKYVEACMRERVDTIAVHNTFSRKSEAQKYFELAERLGYKVFVVECQNQFGNVHGVPQDVIEKMNARWEEDITC